MSPEELHDLRVLPVFPRSAEELIRIAGLEAAARLITSWRGQRYPVPTRVGGSNDRGAVLYARLEELVGPGPAARIVAHWGGQRLEIPNCKDAQRLRVQDRIRAGFDRLTQGPARYSYAEAVFELGLTYDVSARWVETVLSLPDHPPGTPIPEDGAQGWLF